MLSYHAISATQAEVNYYANLGENHDYYSEEGSKPGEWWGVGAKALGLAGDVDAEEFANLLKGYSADGERPLVRNAGHSKRRAGFDLTYSPPKSFSIAWSQAGDESRDKLEACAHRALLRALDALQRHCGLTRRGRNGIAQEDAGLTAAIFRHETARGRDGELPDAQLHFHVVLINVATRLDGTTATLDSNGGLFRRGMKHTLGTLFRAELSKELTQLGIESHRPKKKRGEELCSWFELSAVPPSLIEAMSKRKAEIERWMRERGVSGAKAAEQAALRTRTSKRKHTFRELFTCWRRLGSEHGFGQREAEAVIQNGVPVEVNESTASKDAAERALKRIMDHQSRFSQLELVRFTAEEAQCQGVGIDSIEQVVDDTLANSEEIVVLNDVDGERQFTTKEMLAIEKRMLDTATRLSEKRDHAIPLGKALSLMRQTPSLRPDQRKAITHMTTGSDIACVTGIAGSGKSFTLGVAKDIFERAGYEVLGTTLAAKASRGLEEGSGIRSFHIHKLLQEMEAGRLKLCSKTCLVIDESGLVGTRTMAKLTSLIEKASGKLLLVGDHKQLQAISAGSPFRCIGESVGTVELTKIIRQREAWAKQVVYDLRDGEADRALQALSERGRLFIGADRDAAISRLVSDWKEKALGGFVSDNLVLAGTNEEVRELNLRCQHERKLAGELNDVWLDVDETRFHVHDRVMITRNYRPLGLQNGMMGQVTGILDGRVRIRIDGGYHVDIDTGGFSHISLAYSMSGHKAQGVSVENAWILTGDSMTDREMSYVQGSRARGETWVYADELSVEDTGALARLMNRSRQKDMASEHVMSLGL